MDVRSQVSMVFHLDKCIGCHTCSIACKNIWTDRKGTEYMWWNNVETKPGTGYPTKWEDQEEYRGGWTLDEKGKLKLRSTDKRRTVTNIFHHPSMPSMDDYYEPWTYRYQDLFDAPEGTDQPTARPVSMVTGEPIDIKAGPNWDDDLGGSEVYAANDPNLAALTPEQRVQLQSIERLVFFYLPRICNHCLNPSCVASCPSGALYKRGEDGIVLLDQTRCRGWRSCVAACPYKKVYFNWQTGKSEKCILCFPRLETGQAPACFHSCVGRIRYLGVLLYDADRIVPTAETPDVDLVEAHRSMILDPFDPEVIEAAKRNGIDPSVIESAQRSPVYQFVKVWGLALPPHIEFRTLPMLFYVPPLLPVMSARNDDGAIETQSTASKDLFHAFDQARAPMAYLARLLAAGNEGVLKATLRKQMAVRLHRRAETVGDVTREDADRGLREAGLSREQADAIFRLTALCTFEDRFVIPPMHREEAIAMMEEPQVWKQEAGFGFRNAPKRSY
jgi:nitrate reductase beta subunit